MTSIDNLALYNYNDENGDVKLELFNRMVNEDNAYKICDGAIEEDFIGEIFMDEDIKGYIITIENDYVGFIMFKEEKDYIELKLIGAMKCSLTKNMKLGTFLIDLVKDYALENGFGAVMADVIPGAVGFYQKMGWEFDKDKDEEVYLLDEEISDTFRMFKDFSKKEDSYLVRILKFFYLM